MKKNDNVCTTNKMKVTKSKKKGKVTADSTGDYLQLEKPDHGTDLKIHVHGEDDQTILVEKTVFVLTSVAVIVLTHGLAWAHWLNPLSMRCQRQWFLPLGLYFIGLCLVCSPGRLKWQYFTLDFCYFANLLTYISLWFPGKNELFLVVFALANGPVLVAAAIYNNSLVYHHHDKITSCYIHFIPALLTFCIRWFPETTSKVWMKPFFIETPCFDLTWMYTVPFAFFFLHSVLYCLIVNVIMQPKDPYVSSYGYLAEIYDKLNCIGGPLGQGIVFYGLSLLFCLTSLLPALLAYCYFHVHCALLALVYLVVLWNGGSFYVNLCSKNGFNTAIIQ